MLELSRERDIYESRIISAWREAFARGREVGRQEGYEQRLDEEAAEGRETVEVLRQAIGPIVNPEGHVRRVLAAAESAERRDAAARERAFVAKAYATPPHLRSDAQRATVQAYPPARKDGAA